MPEGLPEIAVAALVLGAVGAVTLGDATGWLRCEQHHLGTQMELEAIAGAIEASAAETGRYPANGDEFQALGARFDAGILPTDYFGGRFRYTPPDAAESWSLCSWGRDHKPGGSGEDGDSCVNARDRQVEGTNGSGSATL